jgi:hypothetical protein
MIRVMLNGVTESTFADSFTVPLVAVSYAFLERGVAERDPTAPLQALARPKRPGCHRVPLPGINPESCRRTG